MNSIELNQLASLPINCVHPAGRCVPPVVEHAGIWSSIVDDRSVHINYRPVACLFFCFSGKRNLPFAQKYMQDTVIKVHTDDRCGNYDMQVIQYSLTIFNTAPVCTQEGHDPHILSSGA